MRSKNSSAAMTAFIIVVTALFASGTHASAQLPTVLHEFVDNGTDGYYSRSGLIFDGSGNLYGTTTEGGTHTNCGGENIGCGTVFELSPAVGGGWTETILHDFNFNGTDGTNPYSALIFDAAGNLYGTTAGGGTGTCNSGENSCGTVFELMPNAGGGWTEKILHNFGSTSADGAAPVGGLIFDAAGNLYGTTSQGGVNNVGIVFELQPEAGGHWFEKVLHTFKNHDGELPLGNLIFDASGNLYGTTTAGGAHGGGTVFELSPASGGEWMERILHSFVGLNGSGIAGGVIFDHAGNLYGTTVAGGPNHRGTVFELTPSASGPWTETILHSFEQNGTDAYEPYAGLIFDGQGNLYGTSFYGGAAECPFKEGCGTVFKLTPSSGGNWAETLYDFDCTNGSQPVSSLTLDAKGNLYGTTQSCGTNYGTVFELTP